MPLAYGTPMAFRAALKARFGAFTAAGSQYSVEELQRQFAYDRLLARVFSMPDADLWVLKGASALLARLDVRVRHTKDVDLYFAERSAAAADAAEALQRAARLDLGDHFRFAVTGTAALPEDTKGRRIDLTASIGAKPYVSYHVDVVVGTPMSGVPEIAPPLTPIVIDGLVRPAYMVFPMADHLADKICATIKPHQYRSGQRISSTRVKDLVDVAIIALTQRIASAELRAALVLGTSHRGIPLPAELEIPAEWRDRYQKIAAEAPITPEFDEAVTLAKRLVDPILAGPFTGEWDPRALDWTGELSRSPS